MSQIGQTEVALNLTPNVSISNNIKFRGYGVVMNVLRITDGIGGLLFIN